MMRFLSRRVAVQSTNPELFNEQSFYRSFVGDLNNAKSEVIIESPFITSRRMRELLPVISQLTGRGVRVYVNTRNPAEHDAEYEAQASYAIEALQTIGVEVLYTVKHHRKLAIIDRQIVWSGSLNILSYSNSCEIMWRMESEYNAKELIGFIKLSPYTGGTL